MIFFVSGSKFMGLKYGKSSVYVLTPESECNSGCPGKPETNCVSYVRNSVYSLGLGELIILLVVR